MCINKENSIFVQVMQVTNPFITSGYHTTPNFCGREDELRRLLDHSDEGVNTILLGAKRIGKTALLQYLLNSLIDTNATKCVYVDINLTTDFASFITTIYNAVSKNFPNIKPTGSSEKRTSQLLLSLLETLDKQRIHTLIAIDEFQQITQYPEKNTLAVLQTAVQKLKHIHFIFCCSNEYALNELAGDGEQAFFANSDLVPLNAIKENTYAKFIIGHFTKHGRSISTEAVDFILAWTRCHTFYTQTLCKRIFSEGIEEIDIEHVHEECGKILAENENDYFIYRNLLSPVQWILLKAIAKEEKVYHPTAKQFLMQHQIGTPANVQRALEALLQKEMVFVSRDEQGRFYQVYDCFLSRWLENLD